MTLKGQTMPRDPLSDSISEFEHAVKEAAYSDCSPMGDPGRWHKHEEVDQARNYLTARIAALENGLHIERLKFESVIKHLTAITALLAPDHIKLPDGRVMEFAPPVESVMAYWRGLTEAIKAAREHVEQHLSEEEK
jgi:hypothetical protein